MIDISREIALKRLMKRRVRHVQARRVRGKRKETPQTHCHYCGGDLTIRAEDNPEGIEARLNWFDQEVAKVLDHYRAKGNLITVNGEKDSNIVHQEIVEALAAHNIFPQHQDGAKA